MFFLSNSLKCPLLITEAGTAVDQLGLKNSPSSKPLWRGQRGKFICYVTPSLSSVRNCRFLCKCRALSITGSIMTHLETEEKHVRGASVQPNTLCKQQQINSLKGCSVSSLHFLPLAHSLFFPFFSSPSDSLSDFHPPCLSLFDSGIIVWIL